MRTLTNPILYWYYGTYQSDSVLEVWDYIIANDFVGKPMAMCRNEFNRLNADSPVP